MNWLPHTTVATIVEDEGRFLMVEELAESGDPVFNQPAGHLDPDETLTAAALRETLEETAWHVELTDFIGVYQFKSPQGVTYIRLCFAARPLRHESGLALDTGILKAHWLSADEILAPGFPARSPMVARTLEDYLAGRRLPLDCIQHHPGIHD